MSKIYADFVELVRDINNLRGVEMLLEWDQQTYMPSQGSKDRSLQLSTISTLVHEKLTSGRMGKLLEELNEEDVLNELTPEQHANVREVEWEYHRASAVPSTLVKELARVKSESFQKWTEAKGKSDFQIFKPYLVRLVELKKEEAESIGYDDRPYDALLDGYEPGLRTRHVEALFSRLRDKLVPLVGGIIDSGIRPDTSFVTTGFPVETQKEFNRQLALDIGFDFDRGRIDEAMHPFTAGTLHDTRITTRYNEGDIRPALFATIHEGGHAMYEQGYLEEHFGTPMGQPVSYGIHESQSRLWENMVGRSLPFWEHYYPKLSKTFPSSFDGRSAGEFYAAVNDVHPSLIRVEADEATYNLHILLRFEMEIALFGGNLEPEDASQVWDEKMSKYLKVDVPDDANGVLQDIHWSQAYFGYFPTYALGNLYAAQFFDAAKRDIPDLDEKIASGNFPELLGWLRENIHRKGKLLRAPELVREVTGSDLDEDIFIGYLTKKYEPLYG